MVVGFRGWPGRGRGMVVGFRGWPAPVHHDDPQQEEHHHKSSSLLYPCIAYISAKTRDIDTKLSGYDPWVLPTSPRTSWITLGTWASFAWVGMITLCLS